MRSMDVRTLYTVVLPSTGDDCSQVADGGYWEDIPAKDFLPQGMASHTAVVWRDSMYVIGGESFNRAAMIYVYDFNGE